MTTRSYTCARLQKENEDLRTLIILLEEEVERLLVHVQQSIVAAQTVLRIHGYKTHTPRYSDATYVRPAHKEGEWY